VDEKEKVSMKTTRRAIAISIALSIYVLRCGGDSDLPEVTYDGGASDEAFERFWDKVETAEVSTTKGAALSSPVPDSEVPKGTPPKISWSIPGIATKLPVHGPSRSAPSLFFSVAEAHLPAVTGNVFLLELGASGVDPVRVFTTNVEWTVDAATWSKLIAGNGPITIQIWNAYLNQNVVEEGPFTQGSKSVRLAP
jgi:hypothetical protein